MNVVHLSPASPTADLRALEEVEDFASTDMGWGGEDTWTYRILPEEQITPELLRRSHNEIRGRVDCVTFQPCSSYEARSQDRYVVQNWDMPGGQWSFSGIFDGKALSMLSPPLSRICSHTLSNRTKATAGMTQSISCLRDCLRRSGPRYITCWPIAPCPRPVSLSCLAMLSLRSTTSSLKSLDVCFLMGETDSLNLATQN